jgi:hypothetical protein
MEITWKSVPSVSSQPLLIARSWKAHPCFGDYWQTQCSDR